MDSELPDLCLCHPAAPSPLDDPTMLGGPRWCGMCSRDVYSLAETSPAHTSVLQTTKQGPQTSTTPHFCILSRVWKQLRQTHRGLGFQQEQPCLECRCCPGMGLWFGAQLPHAGCSPGRMLAAGQAKLCLSPHTSKSCPLGASHCAACRQKYFPSCCPPGAGDELRKQQQETENKRLKRERYRAHTRSESAKNSGDTIHQSYRS